MLPNTHPATPGTVEEFLKVCREVCIRNSGGSLVLAACNACAKISDMLPQPAIAAVYTRSNVLVPIQMPPNRSRGPAWIAQFALEILSYLLILTCSSFQFLDGVI